MGLLTAGAVRSGLLRCALATLILVVGVACDSSVSDSPASPSGSAPDQAESASAPPSVPAVAEPSAALPPATGAPSCPPRMALITGFGDYCIDRHEAALEGEGPTKRAIAAEGQLPEAAISWFDADLACRNAGFRLCTGDEWELACSGTEGRLYPYVGEYEVERCNGAEMDSDLTQQALAPSGSFERCVTPEGVFDLSGNIGEWVSTADVTGTLRQQRGGAYANMGKYVRCTWDPPAFQPPGQVFRGQGFRCCADAR